MLLGNLMVLKRIKTEKEEKLAQISQGLDMFGDKITNLVDYEKYRVLVVEEVKLEKEVMIEMMMDTTKYNLALRKGEEPIISIPELKFHNRRIRVEIEMLLSQEVKEAKPISVE